ncbi:MAG: prolyl oligopeptidase family serine peptidase [Bacteroidota bacterium]
MKKSAFTLLYVLLVPIFELFSQPQTPVVLKDGLVIKLPATGAQQYITPNSIVASITTGSWSIPEENDQINSGDAHIGTWERITSDTSGWFKDDSLTNAYIHFSFASAKEQYILLEAKGNTMVYVNGSARSGNPYGYQDSYDPGGPRFDYSFIPVKLKKGDNSFLFECHRGLLKAVVHPNKIGVFFLVNDITVPDLLVGEETAMIGAIPIANATEHTYKGLYIKTWSGHSAPEYYPVNGINPLSITKIPFSIKLPAQSTTGVKQLNLALVVKGKTKEETVSTASIELNVVHSGETHKETFISAIDGSVQYYAVNPPTYVKEKPALFLSLHGAGVEAINQAQAYAHKNWGYVVAPTNRRPYGYNWENWGRLDALEVLALAKNKYSVDENRVYLTGHSMGGHGTWQLGVHYADQFAALGISAGWISIWSYRIKPQIDSTVVGRMLTRSTKPSDTYAFSTNARLNGIYILQGDADDNVPPAQPESMIAQISKFHKDFVYHVQPGAGHWWDLSEKPGADCVDWTPMFDFFAHHAVAEKEKIATVNFVTSNPAVASKNYWIEVLNQIEQQKISTINIQVDPVDRTFTGTTSNIALFSIDVSILSAGTPFSIEVDSQRIPGIDIPLNKKIYLVRAGNTWQLTDAPNPVNKNPLRCGSFREVLNHRPVFVYGTHGSEKENAWAFEKARYDAEIIWYRGNSSIEVMKDSEFDPVTYKDRSVVLFGNSKTNSAWQFLLKDSPIQVDNKKVTVGSKVYSGKDYACLMIRPRTDCANASVAAVAGTSIDGMKLANLTRYFDQYLNFPDVVIYNSGILESDEKGITLTGYFGNDWSLGKGEFVSQ